MRYLNSWLRTRKTPLIALLFVVCLLAVAWGIGIVINFTASIPLGLYVATKQPTDYVAFCVGGEWEQFALARKYITPGYCPGGGWPLLKPIAARPGDTVTYSPSGIAVNGNLLPNTAPRLVDHLGRPLKTYPFGTYTVPEGRLWVASSYDARSLDSRYYGSVAVSSIRFHLRPLWVGK